MGMMGDSFVEVIVPVKRSAVSYVVQVALTLITAAFLVFGVMSFSATIILGLILIFVDVYAFRRLQYEYEYSYVNGDLDLAKIYTKQIRKPMTSITLGDIELAAPNGSARLDGYKQLPIADFTSGSEEAKKKAFVLVASIKDKRYRILIKADERIIKDLRTRAANKVFVM